MVTTPNYDYVKNSLPAFSDLGDGAYAVVPSVDGGELKIAAKEDVDAFITGEGPHWTYALAEDLGINVFYAGHYATETFGVKALAAHLSSKYHVPWHFLDYPTGL